MDVVYELTTPKIPPIKKRKKVRNKSPHETCKYMTAKINCIALGRRCSCCGDLRCTPEPCGFLEVPEEIQSLDSKTESPSCETEFCKKANRVEEICAKKPSWEPCGVEVEERPGYSESEISCFIEVIEQKLRDSLGRGGEPLICGGNSVASEIPGARIYRGSSLENNDQRACFTGDVCAASLTCDSSDVEAAYGGLNIENVELSKEPGQGRVQVVCGSYKPVILRGEKRFHEYSHVTEGAEDLNPGLTKLDFKIGDVGRSEQVSKWGELDIADRFMAKHNNTISLEGSRLIEDDVVCETKDKFDQLNRFSALDNKGFATLCRQLFRWSYRLSKKWQLIITRPHVVIHLPSMGYPFEIRRRASKSFHLLQNIQVTRLGWLANENAQLLYIFPSNQSLEIIGLFQDLIKNVRPDVTENRLWIIRPDGRECSMTQCLNGSRALFQNSKIYRRVKMLTAGRQAFVLPGVIEEIDVLVASELRAPIMGPPLEFQKHFLNKSNVANFLQKIKVDQPPFVPDVRNFSELCKGLAHLMLVFPKYVTWLIKINYGINGLQTASISFEKSCSREIIAEKKHLCKKDEKELAVFLMEILPGEMIFNKQAYKSPTQFYCDLEKYGGLVQACPYVDYRVLSFGVFVEHDTAVPEVCASADVFHVPHDLTTDLCFGIPQATTARLPLENLVVNVGVALRESQYIGYFGMDVVALRDENRMDKFLVVDIDPHYTDVIAFTDWVKFCLGVWSPCRCCQSRTKNSDRSQMNAKKRKLRPWEITKPEDTMERYAICSGKLYSNGLAKYCGTTLVSLCAQHNIRYNFKIKQGSMICPIDSERRALGLVSLYPKRSRAIDEFAKGLRVLHKLSLEKHNDKIKTNMLKLARALEKRELGRNGNRKRNESFG